MICMRCDLNLCDCPCAETTESLRRLCSSPVVYVGNIIEARIAAGLNTRADFDGVKIHGPFAEDRTNG